MQPAQQSEPRARRTITSEPAPIRQQIGELFQARDLLAILIGRELQVRYKQTGLGVIWIVLQPLVPALIFAVVFGVFAKLPSGDSPYLLFALSGLVLFNLFSTTVSRAGGSLVRDGGLVAKIYFPRALLPLASGLAGIVDFLVGVTMVIVLTIALGQQVTPTLLAMPLIVALTLVLALAAGLAVAALSAHYRDFGLVVPFVLQLLLYGSPIAYSTEILPVDLRNIVSINPLVPLVETFRWSLLGTPAPSLSSLLLGAFSGLIVVAVGIAAFSIASRDLADVI